MDMMVRLSLLLAFLSLLYVTTALPLGDPDPEAEVLERWRRNVGNANTTTSAPLATTTLSWLQKATPAIYIIPSCLVGVPLLCCFCVCLRMTPCCRNCCSCDDEDTEKLTSGGSRTTSRVSPAPDN